MLKDTTLSAAWSALMEEFNQVATKREHPFRFSVLSTVRNNLYPKSRYVVLRKVTGDLSFFMYTDQRSGKVRDINENSQAQLLVYDAERMIQVIVSGNATLHSGDETSRKAWDSLPQELRKPYNPRISPGDKINEPTEAHSWPDTLSSDNFCVIELKASSVEVLQVNKLSHYRALFKKADDWKGHWIAP